MTPPGLTLRSRNLEFFRSVSPDLSVRLSKLPSADSETSKSGHPVFKIRGRYAHSPYDPIREAERQFGSSGYSGQPIVVVFGIGAGYGLLPLAGVRTCRKIILVEEDPVFFSLSCDVVDYAKLFKERAGTVCLGPDLPDFTALLGGSSAEELFVLENSVLTSGSAVGFYPDAKDSFRLFLKHLSAEANTTGYWSRIWMMNSWLNRRHRASAADLFSVKEAFRGYPAVVVSAGPGLDATLDRLKARADRGSVVVASAAAVSRLAAGGVTPHFIVSTDAGFYNSWNTRDGLPDSRTLLVADLSVHPLVIPRRGKTRLAFFDFGLGFGSDSAEGLPGFTMAGTVASSCMELASFLGCAPVTLFGQDFGFPSMRTHCRSTIHERWAGLAQTRFRTSDTIDARSLISEDLSWNKDATGRPVLTSAKHLLYRDWFARHWKGARNASPESVAVEGIGLMTKEEESVLRRDPFDILDSRLRPLRLPGRRQDASLILGRLEDAMKNADTPETLLDSLGPGIGGELRRALAQEIRASGSRASTELRYSVRRMVRIISSVIAAESRQDPAG